MSGKFQIKVDSKVCVGSATCVSLRPDLFELSEEGISKVLVSESDQLEEILDIVEQCPVNAIYLEDKDTG